MLPCLMGLRAILSEFSGNRKKAQRLLLKPSGQVSLRTGIKFVSVDPPPVNSPVWEPASDSLGFISPICLSLCVTLAPRSAIPLERLCEAEETPEERSKSWRRLVLNELPLPSTIPAWEGKENLLTPWPGAPLRDPHTRPKRPSLLARSGDGFKGPQLALSPAQDVCRL